MELVLGKKFKMEVWEVLVQKMALHEVAKFKVDKSVTETHVILWQWMGMEISLYSFIMVVVGYSVSFCGQSSA